ncbi:E3 ubiquitin-protein ligase WAV3-like [Papaver somniferum]|uniref:E3 ubiquitin-protein ligase WAV3-like n=1 Tax=Papaver somniferum TaxID=3469 RepID=UPI000E703AB0|nr:E3 ubiquitin-protein ligase WAV3-like [Papaver somniferum]
MVMICTLCNDALIAGDGNAIFTAECTDSFHFSCITSYVKLGSQTCPTCIAEWKDIPSFGPASNPTGGLTPAPLQPRIPKRRINTRVITSQVPSSEPLVFNDDDPLDFQSSFSSNNISIIRSIDIKTHTEFPAVPRSVSQENFHILVNLKSNVTEIDQVNSDITCRAPIDLVTVLDISGSMTGTKIQLLKRAMGFVIENLGPSDRLSVISFSYNAHRLFPLLLMTDSGKQYALQAVNSLVAGGGTNIVEGLKKGSKVIEDRGHRNPVYSIMLLSDGQDSYTKEINLKEISRLQIPVHTFGFGADHDPIMLHSIAEGSKGTFSFIEAEGLIQDAFAQCIGGLLSVVVQDLQVHIQSLDPHLCLSQLKAGSYSTYLTGDNQTGSVDIGDLYADEERDFLVLVNIPVVADGNSNDQMKLVRVWCGYKDPFTKESVTTEAIEVKLERPEMVNEDTVVSIEVDRQKNRLQAAEAMSNSRAAAERGDLPTAWSIIDGCRMQISDTASAHAGDKFSVDLDLELQEVRSRMKSKKIYESTGRGYLLSGMSSHSRQMATTRGDSTESTYQTASMSKMLKKSAAYLPKSRAPNSAALSSFPPSFFSTPSTASNGGRGGGTANDSNMAFKISSASSLKIQRGDITKWCINGTSDAIVNAANERMLGGAGLNGAIHSAGGPELQAACSTIAEVCPGIRCLKGEARITPAFKLPVSHVIHTVGPIYNVDNHPEVTLRNAYRNCLKLAKENKIEYIAFPAISCGYFGYPYDESATIAISTVMESDGDFKEVHFVLFEDDVFNSWVEKAKGLL